MTVPGRVLMGLVLLAHLAAGATLHAQQNGAEKTKTVAEPAPAGPELRSAREVLEAFLQAAQAQQWKRAAECLDFSLLPPDTTFREKQQRAWQIKEVMDRLGRVALDEVSDDPLGPAYGFPPDDPARPIEVSRNSAGQWRISAATVARGPRLFQQYEDLKKLAGQDWLRDLFADVSPALTRPGFLLPHYQWICLAIVIFMGIVADYVSRYVLGRVTDGLIRLTGLAVDESATVGLWRPIGLLIRGLVWLGGTNVIGLPPGALNLLRMAVMFFAVCAAVWTAFRFVDLLASYLAKRAERTASKFDDLLIPLVSKSLKILAICIGIVLFADMFDMELTGVLTSLGIGGMALAFAAKDALGNFFGSLTVLADRPFEIGDWVILPGAEGSVESVGVRSTRIRTFYNSQIVVPNSLLTTAIVDNMGRRRYRRIKTMLSLQYDTRPEQIDAFCEGVRELIRRHPYTRKDYYHVYFNEFADSSLGVLLYCFLECPDWSVELREKHRLFVDIVRLAKSVGVSFAFPTRTLHLFNEAPPGSPPEIEEPEAAGRSLAAEITGPLPGPGQRRGGVEF